MTNLFRYSLVAMLAGLLFMASCAKTVQPSTTGPVEKETLVLRVMSYNIRHCSPPSKPKFIDLEATVNTIKAQNPDLVALQEVDVNTHRAGNLNQAKEIADRLGMHFFFGKAISYDGGDYGVAILSKYPLEKAAVVQLPIKEGSGAEPRALAYALVQLPGNKEIVFGSTHLDQKGNSENRLLQLEKIASVRASHPQPFIIAGDFNATPGSASIQRLDELFRRTCQDCAPTFPVLNSNKAIDFIAYSPAHEFKVTSHKVIQETYASDHLPIVAELQLTR